MIQRDGNVTGPRDLMATLPGGGVRGLERAGCSSMCGSSKPPPARVEAARRCRICACLRHGDAPRWPGAGRRILGGRGPALAALRIDKLNIARSKIPAVTHVDYSARIQTVLLHRVLK